MKRNTIRIVLALVMVLSICFATAVPATAGDGGGRVAGFASGAGGWTFAGTGNPADYPWNLPCQGSFVCHFQEAHDNQPAKGFCYSTFISDDLGINLWALVRVVDQTIVRGNESWVLGEIVASSEPSYVGTLWIGGAQDGGRQNEDMLFGAFWPYPMFPPGTTPEAIYQLGIDGYLPLIIPVTQGNVVVKP